MGAREIVDYDEVRRWYENGQTQEWMVEQYRAKYGVEISTSAFNNVAARKGWPRRNARDADLIPWSIAAADRWHHLVEMLRF